MLSNDARAIVDDLALRACKGLLAMTGPASGMTLDRMKNAATAAREPVISSTGATGFYLSLVPEFVRRGLVTQSDAEQRAVTSVRFALKNLEHHRGLLRHFVDAKTGAAVWQSEFSLLDTAIFLNGCLVVRNAYPATADDVASLLKRVDWHALLRKRERDAAPLLAHGYDGKTKELLPGSTDVRSSENLMPCLLATGAAEHPIDQSCWHAMPIVRGAATKDDPEASPVLNPTHPLFTSQYGLVWANLEGLHDPDGVDLWHNAALAARWNRRRCAKFAKTFRTYAPENGGWWGISAGDSPAGYVAPDPVAGDPTGTVWPTAALASLPWDAESIGQDLLAWHQSPSWRRSLGDFGLAPFSVDRDWFGAEVVAIDLGCLAATWANFVDGSIHRFWGADPVARRGVEALELSHAG